MDVNHEEIEKYLSQTRRLRLLKLGERALTYSPICTVSSVCLFVWWLRPWLSLPADWPCRSNAWEYFTSLLDLAIVIGGNVALIGACATAATHAYVWPQTLARRLFTMADALERRIKWAQRQKSFFRPASTVPEVYPLAWGLPADVWRYLFAKLPLRTIAKVSLANKQLSRLSWASLNRINSAAVQAIPHRRSETVCSILQRIESSQHPQICKLAIPASPAFLISEMIERASHCGSITYLKFNRLVDEDPLNRPDNLARPFEALLRQLSQPSWAHLQRLDLSIPTAGFSIPDHEHLTSLTDLRVCCELDYRAVMRLTRLEHLSCALDPEALGTALDSGLFCFPSRLSHLELYNAFMGTWLSSVTCLRSLTLHCAQESDINNLSCLRNLETLSLSPTNQATLDIVRANRFALQNLSRLNCSYQLDLALDFSKLTRLDNVVGGTEAQWSHLFSACRSRGCLAQLKYIVLPSSILLDNVNHAVQLWTHPVLFPNLDSIIVKWPGGTNFSKNLMKWMEARHAEDVTPLKLFGAPMTPQIGSCLVDHYAESIKTLFVEQTYLPDPDELLPVLVGLINLEHLRLSSRMICDESLVTFIPRLQHLRVLDLRSLEKFRRPRSPQALNTLWQMPSIEAIFYSEPIR